MKDGLSYLEALRPPEGYTTSAALGTTYSLDLVASLLAVSSLDGNIHSKTSEPSYVNAIKAVEKLKGRVHICFQQGQIHTPRKLRQSILKITDRIVKQVNFDQTKKSFHPKVWVVRYESNDADQFVIYRLFVGSRNLTGDSSWDFGIVVEGTPASIPKKISRRNLKNIPLFIEAVSKVAKLGEDYGIKQFHDLNDVRWIVPEGMDDIDFRFLDGSTPVELDAHKLLFPKSPSRVLALSPFVDKKFIEKASKTWSKAYEDERVRIVAGTRDLNEVYRKDSSSLMALNPVQMGIAELEAFFEKAEIEYEENPDTIEDAREDESRGLHAKAVFIDSGGITSAIFGSPNLTERGWGGRNFEAYVVLKQDWHEGGISDGMWEWSKDFAMPFVPPEGVYEPTDEEKVLEKLEWMKKHICAREYRILNAEKRGRDSITSEGDLDWVELEGAKFFVSRLTTAERQEFVEWQEGRKEVLLPSRLGLSDNTNFVNFKIEFEGKQANWIQHVACEVEPGDDRDRALLIENFGLMGFLRYFKSILDGVEGDAGDPFQPGDKTSPKFGGRSGVFSKEVSVEYILRQLAKDPDCLSDVNPALEGFRKLIESGSFSDLSDEEKLEFRKFWKMWETIRQGFAA